MERRMERLTADKLDAFIDLRLTQLKEEGTLETDLRPALEDYLHRHLADGSFVSWILTEGNRILATSGISFVEKPPLSRRTQRKDRSAVLYVHGSRLPPAGHRLCTAGADRCGGTGTGLPGDPDHCLPDGGEALPEFWLCAACPIFSAIP